MDRKASTAKKPKRKFKVAGYIHGVGTIEHIRWWYSPEQTIHRTANFYKAKHPELVIFLENPVVYEHKNGQWIQVKP